MAQMTVALVLKARKDGSVDATIKGADKLVDELGRSARQARSSTDSLNRSMRRTGAEARKASGGIMALHHKLLGYAGWGGAGFAVHRAIAGVTQATIRQEQALAQVEARIRSTGGAAGYSAGHLAEMAAQFQQMTTFGDEEILEAQSVLLSFRSIAGDAFEQATGAALNLSSALGMDLQSAVIQLGKALDDPHTGLDALSRSGTKFTKEQKDLIRSIVEMGDKAGAQRLILKELAVQYGGAAVAARSTLGGALKSLGNTWGDLLEVQTTHTEALRLRIEDLNSWLASIDVEDLHSRLINLGETVGILAGTLAVGGATALAVWGLKAAGAAGWAQLLAVRAAAADVRMKRAAASATGWGAAMTRATIAATALGRAMLFMAGPVGWLALGAYAFYELKLAGDDAAESLGRLKTPLGEAGAEVERLIGKWHELSKAQRDYALGEQEGRVRRAEQAVADAERALADELAARASREELAAHWQGAAGRGSVGAILMGESTQRRVRDDQSEDGQLRLQGLAAAVDESRQALESERGEAARLRGHAAGYEAGDIAQPQAGGAAGGAAAASAAGQLAKLREETRALNALRFQGEHGLLLTGKAAARELELIRTFGADAGNQLGELRAAYEEHDRAQLELQLASEIARRELAEEYSRLRYEDELAAIERLGLLGDQKREAQENAERRHQGRLADIEKQARDERSKAIWTQGHQDLADTVSMGAKAFGELAKHNKKAFKLHQAFAIGEAIMQTYKGVATALGSMPPPLSFAMAAFTLAFGLAQVATIRQQKPPSGYARGGIVEGMTWFGYDRERRVGYAGEAGPELILPAARGPGGKLGVAAYGLGGQGTVSNVTVSPSISIEIGSATAEDAGVISEAVAARVGELVEAGIIDAQRPGGLLNRA